MLEAVAEPQREGSFLGAFSLLPSMPEARVYRDAVEHARSRFPSGSVVNASIASALDGEFGDAQRLARTSGNELFVNPLMCLYWSFELNALARRSLYLPLLDDTETIFEVSARIEAFRRQYHRRNSARRAYVLNDLIASSKGLRSTTRPTQRYTEMSRSVIHSRHIPRKRYDSATMRSVWLFSSAVALVGCSFIDDFG